MIHSIHACFGFALWSFLAISHSAHAAQPETWTFDPVHTQIVFFADHLGFSKAIGRLKLEQGWFQFDPDDWSTAKADVVVDIGSLDMGEPAWTKKMLSSVFLNAERWPTARFISTSLEKTGEFTGILHGDLWLLGEKQAVALTSPSTGSAVTPTHSRPRPASARVPRWIVLHTAWTATAMSLPDRLNCASRSKVCAADP